MANGNLILVLGDQLSPNLASLRAARPERDAVLLVEVREEATYVKHHKKKIAFLFSAMRPLRGASARRGVDGGLRAD